MVAQQVQDPVVVVLLPNKNHTLYLKLSFEICFDHFCP